VKISKVKERKTEELIHIEKEIQEISELIPEVRNSENHSINIYSCKGQYKMLRIKYSLWRKKSQSRFSPLTISSRM
jgi:hypothetical protein